MNFENFSQGTLLQYGMEANLPIFVKFAPEDFDPQLLNLLLEMKFSLVGKDEHKKAYDLFTSHAMGRILKFVVATPNILRQIESARESDKWGNENIFNSGSVKVYRCKGVAVMVYSIRMKEWEAGGRSDFAKNADQQSVRVMLNRFLAWSMAPLGIVGFWGKAADKNLELVKQAQSGGEAFFIDLMRQKVYSQDGIFTFNHFEQFIKKEKLYKMDKRKASREEAIAFLSMATCWLDPEGMATPIRQMVHKASELWNFIQVSNDQESTQENSDPANSKSGLSP